MSGYKCFNCGKGIMVGHNVSHAKNRTRKVFKPNLHVAKIVIKGRSMSVRLCTKCLRLLKGKSTMARKEALKLKEQTISTAAPAAAGLV
jgi:large subunit ribosomal protein L28